MSMVEVGLVESVSRETSLFTAATCGHEWVVHEAPAERVVKDAYGNVLANGDVVAMIKDLKLNG